MAALLLHRVQVLLILSCIDPATVRRVVQFGVVLMSRPVKKAAGSASRFGVASAAQREFRERAQSKKVKLYDRISVPAIDGVGNVTFPHGFLKPRKPVG